MSIGVRVDIGRWKGSADPVELRAFGGLLGLHLSQREAISLIEAVEGPWVKQESIATVIGGRRAEILGLKIQLILNRMIEEYEKLLIAARVELYPNNSDLGMNEETVAWRENRKKALKDGGALAYQSGGGER